MKFFKSGSSVEVLRRENGPCGSWFPARITSTDGGSYIVMYESFMDCGGQPVAERVQGEDIRPHPPHAKGKRWMVGDIAEVFDIHCWRVGKVAKVLRNSCFVIRLFGSVQLKEVCKSDLRVRQTWHNNKWSVIEKGGHTREIANSFTESWSLICKAVPLQAMCEEACARESGGKHLSKFGYDHGKMCLSVRTIKGRHAYGPEQSSKDLVIGGNRKKRKLSPNVEESSGHPARTLPSSDQVDDISIPQRFAKKDAKMEEATDYWLHTSGHIQSAEDSNQCSVASCSINEYDDFPGNCSNKLLENVSGSSDAESSFPSLCGKQHLPPSAARNLEVDIHKLELHAYNSTILALYASGPLSWEQETLLTNLRFSLHISNEEHLLQLRHLLSAAVL